MGRGTEDEQVLRLRLHNAEAEMACWRDYQYLLLSAGKTWHQLSGYWNGRR